MVATCRRTRREVVVKRAAASDPATALALSVLRDVACPHLPEIVDVVRDGANTWVLTRYVEGRPLASRLAEEGPLEVPDALSVGRAVAAALAALDEAGTHHGDVSPGNVVIGAGVDAGRTVLVDLGCLGSLGVGTPGFLAPEVLAGGGGGPADLFSLGALVYAALAGRPLVRAPDRLAALTRRAVERAVERLAARRSMPSEFADLLVRLLDPDPRARPRFVGGVADRLGSLAGPLTRPGGPLVPSRWPYVGSASALVQAAPAPARVVLVEGPPGSGRDRAIEEIGLHLAAAGEPVEPLPTDTPAALARLSSSPAGRTFLVPHGPCPPDRVRALALAAPPGVRVFAAADPSTAAEVGPDLAVACLSLPPLGVAEAESLARAAQVASPRAWAEVLVRTAGGAAGRIVRVLEAAAAEGVGTPDPAVLGRLSARTREAMAPATARRVLRAAFGVGDAASLSSDLVVNGEPTAAAVLAARRVLPAGERRALAEAARATAQGPCTPLAAAELGDDAALAAWLEGTARPEQAPAFAVVVAMVDERPREAVSVAVRRRVAERQLAAGAAEAVLDLIGPDESDGAARIVRARALLRLGRTADARTAGETLAAEGVPGARGIVARAWMDAGDFEAALRFAEQDLAAPTADEADAAIVGAFAAVALGRPEEALETLDRLERAVPDLPPAVRARLAQVRGGARLVLDRPFEARAAYLVARRAFDEAGELAGRSAADAALANLAVVLGGGAATLGRTRTALAELLARGEKAAAVDLAAALVRLLLRVGDREGAAAAAAAVTTDLEGLSPLARARVERLRAEVAFADAARAGGSEAWQAVGERLAEIGAALEAAGSPREAAEATVRAATAFARGGWTTRGHAVLAASPADAQEPGSVAAVRVAEIELAAAARDSAGMTEALDRLRALGGPGLLAARGRVDLLADLAAAVHRAAASFGLPARVRAAARAWEVAAERRLQQEDEMTDMDEIAGAAIEDLLGAVEGAVAGAAPAMDRDPSPEHLRLERLERIVRIFRRLAHEEDAGRLLEQIVDAMLDVTGAERGAVVVRDADGGTQVVHRGLGEAKVAALSRSILRRVLDDGESVITVDAMEDARFERAHSVSHLNLRSVLAVPMRFRGEVLGAAYVDHRLRRGHFGPDDLADVEVFADLAATAVAHAKTLADLRRKAEALAAREAALGELLAAREAEVEGLRARAAKENADGPLAAIVGDAPPIARMKRMIRRVASSDVPVVIAGESGVGKEVVARAIHAAGGRGGKPFVAENCGAIPTSLLESILFGHARGAFTGADRARAGLFEAADGGTLFLDEIAELPLDVQAKLLRVLQEGEVRRIGETKPRTVDVRILAATNRDLETMVREGTFREDLFYRLDVVRIEVPPLRDRIADLPALVEHLLARHGGGGLRVTPEAMAALSAYDWPGNVRELENEVRRWTVLAEGVVTPADLSPTVRARRRGVEVAGAAGPVPEGSLKEAVHALERRMIERALARHDGNVSAAARDLGLSRYGLHKKIERMGIVPPGQAP